MEEDPQCPLSLLHLRKTEGGKRSSALDLLYPLKHVETKIIEEGLCCDLTRFSLERCFLRKKSGEKIYKNVLQKCFFYFFVLIIIL